MINTHEKVVKALRVFYRVVEDMGENPNFSWAYQFAQHAAGINPLIHKGAEDNFFNRAIDFMVSGRKPKIIMDLEEVERKLRG
jgi:hypothetical protein